MLRASVDNNIFQELKIFLEDTYDKKFNFCLKDSQILQLCQWP